MGKNAYATHRGLCMKRPHKGKYRPVKYTQKRALTSRGILINRIVFLYFYN